MFGSGKIDLNVGQGELYRVLPRISIKILSRHDTSNHSGSRSKGNWDILSGFRSQPQITLFSKMANKSDAKTHSTWNTRQLIKRVYQSLDYGTLATIYCDEGGDAFWHDRRGPCERLGVKLATVLTDRLESGGRSLYIGAGVAEIPDGHHGNPRL